MDRRLELQSTLETLLGSRNVYFQPPENIRMSYPCIVYERSNVMNRQADNNPYFSKKRYSVTVIDRDPDSAIPDEVLKLQYCAFDRHFVTEGLNHDTFTLYF